MKNKQINKFLLMFFLSFSLFFNFSYASIETGIIYTGNFDVTGDYVNKIGSYSISTLYSNVQKYLGGDEDDLISNMNDLINDQIISKWYVILNSSNKASLIVFPYGIDGEVFYCETADDPIFVCFPEPTTSCHYWYLSNSTTCGHRYLKNSNKYCDDIKGLTTVFSPKFSVKSLNKVTEPVSGYQWDGTSYYYKSESEENPSVDYDLANILQVLKNSTEVQDSIYPYLEEYFIIPNGTINNEQVFSVYFYYPSVNLSQFEYVYNDILYYDLDKTSIDGIISKLTYYLGGNTSSNVVKDIQLATLYYNPETGLGDVYFTGNRTFDQLKSFNSKTQPIIYTTKNITYYSATWGETDTEWTATADTSKDILVEEILDSEGNVVSPVLPGSSTVVLGETPLERFINAIQTAFLELGKILSNGLISFTDYLLQIFGENVVTFAFLIIIKAITVLVSSVALVFRFVSFILTLVAIPAISTLLTVDVATNATGLVFTGLNWGTHFMNGLNFIKTIQWNGLGLWTLFEVFVASLEVVLFVKIVRKHYRTL